MENPTTIAIDLSKNVFEIAVERQGRICQRKRLNRRQMITFLSQCPVATGHCDRNVIICRRFSLFLWQMRPWRSTAISKTFFDRSMAIVVGFSMDSSFSVLLRLDDVGTSMPFHVMKEESTSSLQRTRLRSPLNSISLGQKEGHAGHLSHSPIQRRSRRHPMALRDLRLRRIVLGS